MDLLLLDIEKDILASFGKDLDEVDVFRLWKRFWTESKSKQPWILTETFNEIDENLFPIIRKVIKPLMLIPTTDAEAAVCRYSSK